MQRKRILLDIETQADFFSPAGSCYGAESKPAAENIYRLFLWARRYRIPVISTVLRLRRSDISPLADTPYCIEDSPGEQKLPRTILRSHINLGLLNTTDLLRNIFRKYQQVIIEKRHADIFRHARVERLITELHDATFIICGAGVASGIVAAAIGLRSRGQNVILASDAVMAINDDFAEMACLRMEAKGVMFVPTRKITAPSRGRELARYRMQMHAVKK